MADTPEVIEIRPEDVSEDTSPGSEVRQQESPQRRRTDAMRWLLVRITGNSRPQVICKPTRNQKTILGEALVTVHRGIPQGEIWVKPVLQDGFIDLDAFCAQEEFMVGARPIYTQDDSPVVILGREIRYPRIVPFNPPTPEEDLGSDGQPKWLTQGVRPWTQEY